MTDDPISTPAARLGIMRAALYRPPGFRVEERENGWVVTRVAKPRYPLGVHVTADEAIDAINRGDYDAGVYP